MIEQSDYSSETKERTGDSSRQSARYPFVRVEVARDDSEAVIDMLWELGANGVEERDQTTLERSIREDSTTVIGHFEEEKTAQQAVQTLQTAYTTTLEYIEGDEWRDAWRKHYKPTRCGTRLVVRPSWEPFQPKDGDVVLTLDPGAAFGTGTHETTRLLLRAIDTYVKGGEKVLDVGTGSGILSIAALLLGAKCADAWDIDPTSIEVTQENATVNRVADRMNAKVNAVNEWVAGSYDLVLANIELRVLQNMPNDLSRSTRSGGILMLSGLLLGQQSELIPLFTDFNILEAPVDGEWVALVLQKK